MHALKISRCLALAACLQVPALAGGEDDLQLMDFFTLQGVNQGSWSPDGMGLNLSRYHVSEWPSEEYSLHPGYGIRGVMGEDARIEALAKVTLNGVFGAGTGPYFGNNGYGLGASIWYGLGIIGLEHSFYWGNGETVVEKGVYLAIQFGSKTDGKYEFGNWLLDLIKL